MAPAPSSEAFIAALRERLAACAQDDKRDWWERYLKGAVPFRGVPMADIRRTVHGLWAEHEVPERPLDAQLGLALRCFAEPFCEDKLAGVLAIAEILAGDLRLEDVDRLADPFAAGHIADWCTCDWYCVKALSRFVERAADPRAAAEAIAAWRDAEPLWQRRAAAVAFVNHAPKGERVVPGLPSLLLEVCASNVQDPARFMQTSVGWTLRELSRAEPRAVEAFVREHRQGMSTEALRAATAKLPADVRDALRARG